MVFESKWRFLTRNAFQPGHSAHGHRQCWNDLGRSTTFNRRRQRYVQIFNTDAFKCSSDCLSASWNISKITKTWWYNWLVSCQFQLTVGYRFLIEIETWHCCSSFNHAPAPHRFHWSCGQGGEGWCAGEMVDRNRAFGNASLAIASNIAQGTGISLVPLSCWNRQRRWSRWFSTSLVPSIAPAGWKLYEYLCLTSSHATFAPLLPSCLSCNPNWTGSKMKCLCVTSGTCLMGL